jgi:thioredoxin 1
MGTAVAGALGLVGEDTFEERVLASPVPVLVDFFTTWCAPCKALAPTLEDLAGEYGDGVRIVSVDAELSPRLAERYDVKGYPTMVLVRDGAEIGRPTVRSRMQLRAVLDEARGVSPETIAGAHDTEAVPLPATVTRLLAALERLDADAWATVDARVTEAFRAKPDAAPETELPETERVDPEQLSAATTRLSDDIEELAAQRLGSVELASATASAAAASFQAWLSSAKPAPGFMGALRTVPAARMSPYLPAGDVPADPTVAASAYLDRLRALTESEWKWIAMVNTDRWPFAQRIGSGQGAWFGAVILIQAMTTPDLLDADTMETCWAQFAGVLDRASIET